MKNKQKSYIGKKMKLCLAIIWFHVLFLTWVILIADINIRLQVFALITTICITYLQLVLMQDYYFLKKNAVDGKFREDVRLMNKLSGESKKCTNQK